MAVVASNPYRRSAWEDRFNAPTLEELPRVMDPEVAPLFEQAHRLLVDAAGPRISFTWRGECWRWTIDYGTTGRQTPIAIIIPNPLDMQIGVPVRSDFLDSLPTTRMKRALRDGLSLAQAPFDTEWAVWSIQTRGLLEDVVDLIERKIRFNRKRTG